MNSLDIALILIIGLSAWGGWKRGLFVEIASLIGLVAGVFGAIYFSGYAGGWLENSLDWEPKYRNLAAFAVTFGIIAITIQLAGKLLTKVADFTSLGVVNKFAGATFGGIKMAFIISIALMWVTDWGFSGFILTEERKEDSALFPLVEPLAPVILPDLIDDATVIYEETKEDLRLNPED